MTDTTAAVTGLGTVLGVLVTGLIVGAVAVFIFILRRKIASSNNITEAGTSEYCKHLLNTP